MLQHTTTHALTMRSKGMPLFVCVCGCVPMCCAMPCVTMCDRITLYRILCHTMLQCAPCCTCDLVEGNPLHHLRTHCNTLHHTTIHCNTLQNTRTSDLVEGDALGNLIICLLGLRTHPRRPRLQPVCVNIHVYMYMYSIYVCVCQYMCICVYEYIYAYIYI